MSIGIWLENALSVLDQVAVRPQILVGASVGGWISLLLSRLYPESVKALVLLAPVPDYPTAIIYPLLTE